MALQLPPPFTTFSRRGRLGLKGCVSHAGVTLIELLVVVTIIVMLAGAMVPLMRPALEEQGVREASRQLNAYLSKAQALATERGRPVGVWIEPSDNNPNVAFQLFIAESPPPYAGDSLGAKAKISGGTATFLPGAGLLDRLVHVGDLIKFNFQGPFYRIASVASGSVTFEKTDPTSLLNPPSTVEVPYQIFRKPVRSAASSITLPNPAVIDLSSSGLGASGQEFGRTNKPIIITFHPSGGVDQVFLDGTPQDVLEPIYLLIGRIDQGGGDNLEDMRNRWVTVGHRTGLVTTAENAGGTTPGAARKFARTAQNMGGR